MKPQGFGKWKTHIVLPWVYKQQHLNLYIKTNNTGIERKKKKEEN